MRAPDIGLLALLAAACAARPPACPVEELAAAAVAAGQSAAEIGAAHPECSQAELAAAYGQALAAQCAPERGWDDGRSGAEPAAACRDQGGRLWLEAFNLGQREREFGAELKRLDAEIAALERSVDEADQAAARRAGLERVRLIRELEAIRGAARVRGWK